jgi:hypothetical protein
MGLFKRFFDDYFDDRAKEISENGGEDTDSYDETNEVMDPHSPIWKGSEIHSNPYGPDPTLPDPNEVNQD